jgi:uncharacterized protein DUF3800
VRLIRGVVPKRGCLVVLAESYFDETNTHRGDERLCIGGYIFMGENAERQAQRWEALRMKWNLPFFHMTDCAHNTGVFAHLDKNDCDRAAREAISIIKETASAGVCITVLESEYLEIVPQLKFFGSAYDACARYVLSGVSGWIESTGFEGSMHYFFEAGAATEKNASYCIMQMMNDPEIKSETRYAGHSFVPKDKSPGVQAADILAWHAGQDCRRALKGMPIRKDFASLTEIPHVVLHLTREKLQEHAHISNSTLEEAGLTHEMVNALEKLERRTPKRSSPRG